MQLYFSHMVALMTLAWLSFRNISMYLGRPAVCMHAFWMRVGGWVGVGWLDGGWLTNVSAGEQIFSYLIPYQISTFCEK